jgi:tape measure domain-containing protein
MALIKNLSIGLQVKHEAFKKKMQEAGKSVSDFAAKTKQSMSEVAASMGQIGGGIAAAAGAGFAAFSVSAVKAAAEAEQTEIAFSVLFGSVEKGNAALAELKQFADVTPFNTDEVIKSGKSLKAFGFEANNIVPTMTRLGDIAAGLNIPINELSELYGKARTQGTLFAQDINQLTGRGIPIISELAKVMGVAESEVKKLTSEGKIGFTQLEQAFKNMTSEGSQFGGLMAKQSDSVSGKWSNLMAVIDRITINIGKIITKAFDVKGALVGITDFVASLEQYLPVVEGFYESIKIAATDFAGAFAGAFDGIGVNMKRVSFTIRASVKGIQISALYLQLGFVKAFNSISYYLTEFLPAGFSYLYNNAKDIFTDIFNFVTSVVTNLGKNITALIVNLPALLTGELDLSSVLVPLDEGFQRVRANFYAPIPQSSPLEESINSMIGVLKDDIQKDFNDVFNTLPQAAEDVKKPLTDTFSSIFGAIGENIKSKISSAAEFALKGVEVGKDLLDKSKNAKEDKQSSFGSALFGSTDTMKKVIAKGIDMPAKDKDEKTKKAVEAGNKLLDKAVGFLGTLVNKTPPAFEL